MTFAPSLLLRPDHGDGVGSGHIARCHALAEAWVRVGGSATVWSSALPEPWPGRFASIGVEITTTPPTAVFDWAAVDGYRTDGDGVEPAGEHARHLLVIDDHALSGRQYAEVVVDQNFGATARGYPSSASLLLGPRYALLRSEFATMRPAVLAPAPHARRVIYLMGGAPDAATTRFVAAARVAVERAGFATVEVRDQTAVAAAMSEADIALSAAGSTFLELCCLGVPCILFVVAPNQRPGARAAADAGVAIHAGDFDDLDASAVARLVTSLSGDAAARARMATRAWTAVDGRGPARVVTRMRGRLLSLRPATIDDAAHLFDWRNDATTRASSFSTEPIEWAGHLEWLQRTLASDTSRLFIVDDAGGEAVAQVRFDERGDGTAEISVGVSPSARGQGIGAAAIEAGVQQLWSQSRVDRILARIKPGNDASIASFVNADFDRVEPESAGTGEVLLYSRSRDAVRA